MNVEIDMKQCMPLPGDVWRTSTESGDNYFVHAVGIMTESVDTAIQEGRLPVWSDEFVKNALYYALSRQSTRNGEISGLNENYYTGDPRWEAMLTGNAEPNELVALRRKIGKRATDIGIEMARLTHVGIWDTEDTIDAPVRRSLVNDRGLRTMLIEGQPYYKQILNHDKGEIVERKRLIATHFGDPYTEQEQFWTARRDIMLVDFEEIDRIARQQTNELMPEKQSDEAKRVVSLKTAILDNRSHDHSARVGELNDVIEPILDMPIDLRPRYVRPLLTTMYIREPSENVKPMAA